MRCASCGEDNPERARFCLACGSPLAQERPPSRERKVVSVLFCDIVGFTARSERQDPEDVHARVAGYYARLRRELEAYGGTVEKFIGDAVMAVFGAPVAHEDDAERAVHAGLRILEAIDSLNAEDPGLDLHVRIGVNTGEVLVTLESATTHQGVLGDVVNTAARIQTAAPITAAAVGVETYGGRRRVFRYEPLEPVEVKGKSEPLPLYRAVQARARFGRELERDHTSR